MAAEGRDNLRQFIAEVEWEGKDDTWVDQVVTCLADNDIVARVWSCVLLGALYFCMLLRGPGPFEEYQIWASSMGHLCWEACLR